MKRLLIHLFGLVVPRETASADPPKDPPADPPKDPLADPPKDPPANPAPISQDIDPTKGRPDWVPEKFWNPDVGIRVHEAMKGYAELEGKLRTKKDELRAELETERQKAAPEKYELKMPDDIKIPDGMDITLDEADPLAQWFTGLAKNWGMSQDQFNAAIRGYVEQELASMPKVADELAKLGDYATDRIQRVENWLYKSLAEPEYKALQPWLTDAASVQALEKLMKTSSPGDFDGDTQGETLTLEELRKMQDDPRYWRDQDKAFIAKVEAGYKRLYARG